MTPREAKISRLLQRRRQKTEIGNAIRQNGCETAEALRYLPIDEDRVKSLCATAMQLTSDFSQLTAKIDDLEDDLGELI